MNHSDSERISGFLESNGYEPINETPLSAEALAKADLVIFNTCGVRQMAEDRVYGQIHNLANRGSRIVGREAQNTKPIIILTGCLANRPDVQKRLKGKVDLFFSINDFKKFENFVIENSLKIENLKLKIAQKTNPLTNENIAYLSINPKHTNTYRAFVPIMTGCNNFCSYCVVPFARGREVSRPAEEIISEVKNLIKSGYKEIILLGQNVNSYKDEDKRDPIPLKGSDPYSTVNFSQLLKKIDALPGKFWIHFVSNHPKDVTQEMIETVAQCKKVCEVFHLPIQSGNDEVIKKMNRKYTAEQYLKLVKKIKSAYKKYKPENLYSITSDIIVGFPGETRKQFLDSAEIMKAVGYDMVFFGQFSPRPQTAAWNMKDNVSKAEKVRREKYLNEILKKTVHSNNKKYVGQVLDVLIEKEGSKSPIGLLEPKQHTYFGRTRTGKNVKISASQKNLIGQIIKVKITKANIWNLEGKL